MGGVARSHENILIHGIMGEFRVKVYDFVYLCDTPQNMEAYFVIYIEYEVDQARCSHYKSVDWCHVSKGYILV